MGTGEMTWFRNAVGSTARDAWRPLLNEQQLQVASQFDGLGRQPQSSGDVKQLGLSLLDPFAVRHDFQFRERAEPFDRVNHALHGGRPEVPCEGFPLLANAGHRLEPEGLPNRGHFRCRVGTGREFELQLLTPDTYQLRIEKDGYTSVILNDINVADSAPTDLGIFSLLRGAIVTGLVLDPDDHSVPGAQVVMIESNAKKAAFLKQVSRLCSLNTRIINARVELLGKSDLQQVVDMCVARALAPLPGLLELTAPLPVHPQRLLFLQGQDVDVELTEATKCWNISFCKHSSRTQQNGCILEIHEAKRVSENTTASD